jgi:acyl-coenzyme A synthetase/AMP-(fatty) acid ligase
LLSIVCQDGEGYYWYQGRSDGMFNVHGQWVSPLEIEEVLRQHMAVHKYPCWIHFRHDLPRTATGMLQRYQLVQAASAS